MKKSFPTLWTNKEGGFVALPVLALIILGTAVVGGGGYTVYKMNQMEQKNAEVVADLQAKLELAATTTKETEVETATSTEMATTTETELEPKAKPAQAYTPASSATVSAVVDVCLNMEGLQSVVPDGYKLSGTSCVQMVDRCPNLQGVQELVPSGLILSSEYGCITERELEEIDEKKQEQRQAEQKAKECTELKTSVYEMDQQILDIQASYQKKLSDMASAPGQTLTQATSYKNSLNNQMYSEISPIEIERTKLANEYNFKCI